MYEIATPYLLFLGDARRRIDVKTASGVAAWRPEFCAAQLRMPGATVDLGLPEVSIAAAIERGIRTLVVGVAPAGGELADDDVAVFAEALRSGMDIANGLHTALQDVPALAAAAKAGGSAIHDIRHARHSYRAARFERRSGRRLLTVGTDCCVGKMYTALAIEKAMRARSMAADFRASGQTGILIAGAGIPIDAVIADFIASSAEQLSPENTADHWDIVEGQGSLSHPGYAGVSLGLLHGSQPDAIVLCHEAGRDFNSDFPALPLPELHDAAAAALEAGRLTNNNIALVGASINTSSLEAAAAASYLTSISESLGVPAVDPMRGGVEAIVDAVCERFGPRESARSTTRLAAS